MCVFIVGVGVCVFLCVCVFVCVWGGGMPREPTHPRGEDDKGSNQQPQCCKGTVYNYQIFSKLLSYKVEHPFGRFEILFFSKVLGGSTDSPEL